MAEDVVRSELEKMRAPQTSTDYYAVTLVADEAGRLRWSVQSSFFGYRSQKPVVELRVAAPVIPEAMMSLWRDVGQSCCVVSNRRQLFIYLHIGGNALMETSIAAKLLPFIREPFERRPVGIAGFEGTEDLPKSALQRTDAASADACVET